VEKAESRDRYLLRSDVCHFLSSALSSVWCSRRTSDNQGLEVVTFAGLVERGQMLSKDKVRMEHEVSVAVFTSRDEKCEGEGREDDTAEERWDGERVHRFRLKVTAGGVGGVWVISCRLKVMSK